MVKPVIFPVLGPHIGWNAHDWEHDTFKVLLTNEEPPITAAFIGHLKEIEPGNGYESGGNAVTLAADVSGPDVVVSISGPVSWTANGGSIGPFGYAVLYNATGRLSGGLMAFWRYGGRLALPDGETFSIEFSTPTLIISR